MPGTKHGELGSECVGYKCNSRKSICHFHLSPPKQGHVRLVKNNSCSSRVRWHDEKTQNNERMAMITKVGVVWLVDWCSAALSSLITDCPRVHHRSHDHHRHHHQKFTIAVMIITVIESSRPKNVWDGPAHTQSWNIRYAPKQMLAILKRMITRQIIMIWQQSSAYQVALSRTLQRILNTN